MRLPTDLLDFICILISDLSEDLPFNLRAIWNWPSLFVFDEITTQESDLKDSEVIQRGISNILEVLKVELKSHSFLCKALYFPPQKVFANMSELVILQDLDIYRTSELKLSISIFAFEKDLLQVPSSI